MDEPTRYEHLPYQPFKLENPTYILPDLRMNEELLDVKDPLYQPLKLEPSTEVSPNLAVKEDLLDIKDEPGIFHHLVVSGDDADECNTDNKINLRNGSDKNLVLLCEEESVGNSPEHHNTASPDYGMQLSLSVKSSSLPDNKIPSVLHYSKDTVKMKMYKKRKTSTFQNTEIQIRPHGTNKRNEPSLQYDIFDTSVCNESKTYTCDTCHKCFSAKSSWKRHIIIHTGGKPYTCDTCHKCFSQLTTLKTHNKIHTGSKPYTCNTCNKCFSDLSHLKTHVRIHTGSKPYICDTCNKCFNQLSHLKEHVRLHTGRKPYTCDTCSKCFSHLSYLKRHIQIHIGSKTYTCDTCRKCFSQLSYLKKHIRIHTRSRPYTCDT